MVQEGTSQAQVGLLQGFIKDGRWGFFLFISNYFIYKKANIWNFIRKVLTHPVSSNFSRGKM